MLILSLPKDMNFLFDFSKTYETKKSYTLLFSSKTLTKCSRAYNVNLYEC